MSFNEEAAFVGSALLEVGVDLQRSQLPGNLKRSNKAYVRPPHAQQIGRRGRREIDAHLHHRPISVILPKK